MKKEVLDYVIAKTKDVLAAPMSCQELKDQAQAWLDAVGTDREAEETKKYIAELEVDIMPLDNLIGFASSDEGKKYFGEETANEIVIHAQELKAAGEKYCDCPACSAVAAILEKKAEM